ncbi:MAG: hypothetical protein ABJN65_12425 [Parasphingorhabdus sp.]
MQVRRMEAALLCVFALGFATPVFAQAEPAEPVPQPPSSVESFSLPPGNNTPAPEPAPTGPVDDTALPSVATPAPVQPLVKEFDAPVVPVTVPSTVPETAPQSTRSQRPTVRTQLPTSTPSQVAPQPDQRPEPVAPQVGPNIDSSDQDEQAAEAVPSPTQPLQQPNGAPIDQPTAVAEQPSEQSVLYWVIPVAIILLAGLGFLVWRRKGKAESSDINVAGSPSFVEQESEENTKPPAEEPAPTAAPEPIEPTSNTKLNVEASSDGFVTTKIRKVEPAAQPTPTAPSVQAPLSDQLSIEFQAESASSTLINAVVGYSLIIKNGSDQLIKDLHVSGTMLQADKNLAETAAASQGQLLHEVGDLAMEQTTNVSGDIRLPLAAFQPIDFQSQKLFVPLILLRFDYIDGNGNAQMQAANYLVGTEHIPPREKMAPFRLDLGPRNFGDIAHRPFQS